MVVQVHVAGARNSEFYLLVSNFDLQVDRVG